MPPKNDRIALRLSHEDYEKIKKKAGLLDMKAGTYLRFLGLNVDIEVLKKVRQSVNKPY